MNTKTPIRLPTNLIALAVATMSLAGCLPGLSGNACVGPEDDIVEAGTELTVLTHGAFSWAYEAIKDDFENQTGVKLIELEGDDAGSALNQAILNKGNPVADVIYGIDNALFVRASEEGILHPYNSPNLGRVADYIDLDQFRDTNGNVLATPADQGFININIDAEVDDPPTTLRELAHPEWAQTFVTQDPRTSSPGLGFLVASVATFGTSGDYTWTDYWQDLFENGVLITSDWTEAYALHFSANGFGAEGAQYDKQIVTSYTSSPAAEVYYGRDYGVTEPMAISMEPPDGVFHQIETVAILECAANPAEAAAFVDYVLTEDFQSIIPDTMAIYPVDPDVDVPQDFKDYATAPADLDVADFTAAELGSELEGWVDTWEGLFQAHYA